MKCMHVNFDLLQRPTDPPSEQQHILTHKRSVISGSTDPFLDQLLTPASTSTATCGNKLQIGKEEFSNMLYTKIFIKINK